MTGVRLTAAELATAVVPHARVLCSPPRSQLSCRISCRRMACISHSPHQEGHHSSALVCDAQDQTASAGSVAHAVRVPFEASTSARNHARPPTKVLAHTWSVLQGQAQPFALRLMSALQRSACGGPGRAQNFFAVWFSCVDSPAPGASPSVPRDDALDSCCANTLSGMRGADSAPPVDRVAVRADTKRQASCSSALPNAISPTEPATCTVLLKLCSQPLGYDGPALQQHCAFMGRKQ